MSKAKKLIESMASRYSPDIGSRSSGKLKNCPCIARLKNKGVSCGTKEGGFVVYTHRATSKVFPTQEAIPMSVVKRIESTG